MLNLLYAVFVLSGAAGLMYESIWARYLGLFVGHSAYAQVIVLVIFMGSMSAGALFAGERSAKLKSPLLWYAGVELVAGIIGLLFHDAFQRVTAFAYEHVFPALGTGALEMTAKWAIAALLIVPQSLLLGATFPLMSAGVVRIAPERGGRSLALLYFTNSFGAAAGVLVAGFYLVALAGLPGTLVVAATLNIVVALVVFIAARRAPEPAAQAAQFETAASEMSQGPPRIARLLLLVAFGTAVASFVYEIAWVRMLSLVLGSATHAFELMLSAFILGLALGALWVRTRVDSGSVQLLATVQLAMGSLAIATLPVYLASFDWMAKAMSVFARSDAGYDAMSVFRYGLCLAVMLPATFCAGMTLPVITRLLLRTGAGERAIGRVYGVNTLGSIVGVSVASLALMPLLGLKWLLVLGGCIDIALGVLLVMEGRRGRAQAPRYSRRAMALAGVVAMALLAILAGSRFDRTILTSGVYRYGFVQAPGTADVLFYRDGRTASVSVRRIQVTGGLSLATNGKPDASLGPEWMKPVTPGQPRMPFTHNASTQTLLGVIPLAFRPDMRTVAVIGQGSGMSSHTLLANPSLERLVTIEIEPEMIRASRLFYPANRRVFDDPRSTFAIDDARSYLAAANDRYDLILSEPSNPWVAGISGLFTAEFYAGLSRHLTDDGILAQWLHVSEIDDGLVLSVVAALDRNFASYVVFATSNHDVVIIASRKPQLPAPDWSVVQRFPGLVEDLARVTPLTPQLLESLRVADHRALGALARSAAPNSDFYPVLDLNAERAMYMRSSATGFAYLAADRFSPSLAIAGARSGFVDETQIAIAGVPRVEASARAASLRARRGGAASDVGITQAAFRNQVLRQSLVGGSAPVDWRAWTTAVALMEADLHGGSAGVTDSAFYRDINGYLRRVKAPVEARAAVDYLHALSAWDYAGIVRAGSPLLADAERGSFWLAPDLLRDGMVTAELMEGNSAAARDVFIALAQQSQRDPTDLRTMVLEALVREALSQRGMR